jgi:hypothetical protein
MPNILVHPSTCTCTCEHVWPGDLDTEADCLRCGLSYSEWSC